MKGIIVWGSLAVSLLFASCSSKEVGESCPSVEEEPISVCRARQKCRNQNSSVGVGVGFGLGNFGIGAGHSTSTGRYESCLDQDLVEQREKAKTVSSSQAPAKH